jgi:hypothetical protein
MLFAFLFQPLLSAQRVPKPVSENELPPSAEQVAKATGLLPLFNRLQGMAATPSAATNPLEVLSLRQAILEAVMSSSLQVDATMAQIDNEIAQAGELRGYLVDRRDREVNLLNLTSLATGGVLTVVSSALQLSPHLARKGNAVGIGSGVLTTTLSVVGLKAQKGQSERFNFPSNMLAQLFGQPTEPTSQYPPAIWEFMTSVAPTDPDKITRQQRLIRTWVQVGRIDPPQSPKGREKIERVTSRPSDDYKLTIDDLEDRQAMLQDLRAKLSLMKRDLGALLQALPKNLTPPLGSPIQQ